MSAKYHVNPKTGRPGVCRAVHNCRFGDEKNHYDSKDSAQKAIEEKLKELNVAPPITRKPPEKPDVSTKSEEEIRAERKKLADKVDSARKELDKFSWDKAVVDDIIKDEVVTGEDLDVLREARQKMEENETRARDDLQTFGKELEDFDSLHQDRLAEIEFTKKARAAADRITQSSSVAGAGCDQPRTISRSRC